MLEYSGDQLIKPRITDLHKRRVKIAKIEQQHPFRSVIINEEIKVLF